MTTQDIKNNPIRCIAGAGGPLVALLAWAQGAEIIPEQACMAIGAVLTWLAGISVKRASDQKEPPRLDI